ncbi:MAG TPA: hypothetical protein PLN30_12905 [Ferruginibacter sp.]|nr:hypothetical protein [Ferruginibacter sp.]
MLFFLPAKSQFLLSGRVFDKSKINYVEFARVISTGGNIALTDSMGRYAIVVKNGDSVYFVYDHKPTQKFAVNGIANYDNFNVSLHIYVTSKYSLLKEVIVQSKTYRQDSLENRQHYAQVFNFQKPGLVTQTGTDGTVGFDANEIINTFRFKRNKRLKAFQRRLEKEEEEKYVDYRFSKFFVSRITGLKSPALDSFLVKYRPDYEFVSQSTELDFNQYVLDASYQFRKLFMLQQKN